MPGAPKPRRMSSRLVLNCCLATLLAGPRVVHKIEDVEDFSAKLQRDMCSVIGSS